MIIMRYRKVIGGLLVANNCCLFWSNAFSSYQAFMPGKSCAGPKNMVLPSFIINLYKQMIYNTTYSLLSTTSIRITNIIMQLMITFNTISEIVFLYYHLLALCMYKCNHVCKHVSRILHPNIYFSPP